MSTIPPPSSAVDDEIQALGPWFHNLHLPDGRQTCPDHWLGDFPMFKWRQLAPHLPDDLTGWSCLDIGCNAGFYSFELARRGGKVLGIDSDARYLRQAEWAANQMSLADQVRFEQMQVYDLARRNQMFDLILFMGVFYHLRYPMLGLDIVCQKVRRLLVFQSLSMPGEAIFEATENRGLRDRKLLLQSGWPKMAFLEHAFAGDPTNWWAPNHSACRALLRSAGMRLAAQPGHEIYLAEPDPQHPSCMTGWDRPEFSAAIGRE